MLDDFCNFLVPQEAMFGKPSPEERGKVSANPRQFSISQELSKLS